MNNDAMKEVLNELFSHLERLETQNEAILQFLKEKKRVTDKQLAPYLEQAGNASNVKWRAARVRINHLLEPEHPEKEIKLGKKPELHEDSSSAASDEKRNASADKEDKRVEPVVEEGKRTAPGDQKQIESSDSKGQRAKIGRSSRACASQDSTSASCKWQRGQARSKIRIEQYEQRTACAR